MMKSENYISEGVWSGSTGKGQERTFWYEGIFYLISGLDYKNYAFVKTQVQLSGLQLRFVHFIVCKILPQIRTINKYWIPVSAEVFGWKCTDISNYFCNASEDY